MEIGDAYRIRPPGIHSLTGLIATKKKFAKQ